MNYIKRLYSVSPELQQSQKLHMEVILILTNIFSSIAIIYLMFQDYLRMNNLGIKFEVEEMFVPVLYILLPIFGILYFTKTIKGKIVEWILVLLYSIAGVTALLLSLEGDPGSEFMIFVVLFLLLNASYFIVKIFKRYNVQIMRSVLLRNKFLIIGIIILSALFTWFEIRPTIIKKECAESARYNPYSSSNFSLDEEEYKNCLRVSGI